jgi:redox-sensitive bicupin YhaK (pirin superfamily)
LRIISGEFKDVEGPIELYFPVDYFDVRLNGGVFEKNLKGTNLIYVHTGKVNVISEEEELEVETGSICLIKECDKVQVKGENAGFLFLSADPLNEPIAKYGPFVMNTMDEVLQAMDDYSDGVLDK